MASEFKNFIFDRLGILFLALKFGLQIDNASIFNKWGNIMSTIAYSATYLFFIEMLFANINTFAGYTKNEIIILSLFTQLAFYFFYVWASPSLDKLLEDVKTGNLDAILTKPLPTLFYISFRKISIIDTVRDGIPPSMIIFFAINWNEVNVNLINILIAVLAFICGQIAIKSYNFLLIMPSFYIGEADSIRGFGMAFDDLQKIPYEFFDNYLKFIFTILLPTLGGGVLSASIFLGKTDLLFGTLISVFSAVFLLILKRYFWNKALKVYSSASS
jgi:ABC-2 type transport system permease protein